MALAILLLTPLAQAEPSEGEVILRGHLSVHAGAHLEGPALAAYLNDTSATAWLNASSPRVVVTLYTTRAYGAEIAGKKYDYFIPEEPRTRTFHNASIHMQGGSAPGWLGVYPGEGATAAVDDASLRARAEGSRLYGNSMTPETPPQPDLFVYGVHVPTPHIGVTSTGKLQIAGHLAMKIQGLDLRVEGDEGATSYETFLPTARDLAAGESRQAWVHIELEGHVTLQTYQPVEIAIDEAALAWTGPASLLGEGTITSSRAQYTLDGPTHLRGTWTAQIVPSVAGSEAVGIVTLRGDLYSTTARSISSPSPAPISTWPFVPLAVLAVALVGAGVAAVAFRRSRGRRHIVDIDALLRQFPHKPAEALYGAAVVEHAYGNDEQALHLLSRAGDLEPKRWLDALHDPDLSGLKAREDFRRLVNDGLRRAKML